MNRPIVATLVAVLIITAGCTKKESAPAGGASPAATQVVLPERISANFTFNDVSVTTTGTPVVRLGFDIRNISKDPLQCDPSEFTIRLSDGAVIAADESAENKCNPDSVEVGATGKAVMYFDLKSGYSGPLTLTMTANDAIVGRGNTALK
jgi:hypothetical protein